MYKFKSIVLGLIHLVAQTFAQNGGGYMCPIKPSTQDAAAIKFAHTVQQLLYNFYNQTGMMYSASDFSSLSDSMNASSLKMAQNIATNVNGIERQAMLGLDAIDGIAISGVGLTESSIASTDSCSYTYPPGMQFSAMDFLKSAFFLEATLCGTFIGLADYVQMPQAAFLMARMSAEHALHAAFFRSLMDPGPYYSADSMSLTPAFTPSSVLIPGSGYASPDNVGHLGQYIPSSCVMAPMAPCGGEVMIGNLTAMLSGGNTGFTSMSAMPAPAPSMTTSATMGAGSGASMSSAASSVAVATGAAGLSPRMADWSVNGILGVAFGALL